MCVPASQLCVVVTVETRLLILTSVGMLPVETRLLHPHTFVLQPNRECHKRGEKQKWALLNQLFPHSGHGDRQPCRAQLWTAEGTGAEPPEHSVKGKVLGHACH